MVQSGSHAQSPQAPKGQVILTPKLRLQQHNRGNGVIMKSLVIMKGSDHSFVSERKAEKNTQSAPWKRNERQRKESCCALTLRSRRCRRGTRHSRCWCSRRPEQKGDAGCQFRVDRSPGLMRCLQECRVAGFWLRSRGEREVCARFETAVEET